MSTLTGDKTAKAKACNLFYSKSNGIGFPEPFGKYESDSEELALAVAQWQEKYKLHVDGIIGPKTLAALKGHDWQKAKGEYHLIVGGKKIPTSFPVVNWMHQNGLSFPKVLEVIPSFNGIPPRDDPRLETIDKFVLHWDEAHSSHDCFHTLIWRNLAVQLCLDSDGTVYQTMDLLDFAARHARWANQTSVGIEIANPIYPSSDKAGYVRDIVEETKPHTEGETWRYLGFTQSQKDTISQLVLAVCDAVGIPKTLPQDEGGQVWKHLMPDPYKYKGVLGHYHLQLDKVDPGYSLWPVLIQAFNN